MKAQDGDLSFAASISTDEFDAGLNHIENKIMDVASGIETESARIQSLLNSSVPDVDISFLTNAVPTLNNIGEAYAECHRVIRENKTAVNELSAEYKRLTEESNKFANVPSKKDDYLAMRAERDAIKQNIAVRQEVIKQANEQITALEKEEKNLIAAAKAADKSTASMKNNNVAASSLKTRIKELEAEAAMLVESYQREGRVLDQSKGRYREIIEELGRLRDIRGDIQTAGSIFANDESQFAGVISGLSGIAGAASAAQGAIGLFGIENDNLQQIMMKVQSLMAITIGLQQLQQTLNKDSAFTLVTLNSLKKLWNKLTGESNAVIETENAAIAQNTVEQEKSTVATEQHAVAQQNDAAATTSNTNAGKLNTADKKTNTIATQQSTVATESHTVAMTTSTVATNALTRAMKFLKIALISTGIGALIWGIGELVAWITKLIDKQNEAKKRMEELNKIHSSGYEIFVKEKLAMDDSIKTLKNFNGTKEQEKKKVEELNSKYGEYLGYHKSVAEWQTTLINRGKSYIEFMKKKAIAQAALNRYTEDYVKLLELNHKTEQNQKWTKEEKQWFDNNFFKTVEGKMRLRSQDIYESVAKEMNDYAKKHGLDEIHIDPTKKTGGSGKTFDPYKAAADEKKLIDAYQKQVSKYIKDASTELSQEMINGLTDGLGKEITTIRWNGKQREAAWRESLIELAVARKQMLHDAFMTQKGATEEKWAKSADGKKSISEYLTQILGVSIDDLENAVETELTDVGVKAQQMLQAINASTERMIKEANDKYFNQFISEYGTTADKTQQLLVEWTNALNSIPAEIIGQNRENIIDNINKAFKGKIDALDFSALKESLNWEEIFGNLDSVSTQTLQSLRTKLQAYINTQKDLSPESLKTIVDTLEKIDDKLTQRNPFDALRSSFTTLKISTIAVQKAQEDYNKALESGTDAEKKNAEAALNAARNAKQKALVNATAAIQGAIGQMKEYIGVATALSDMLETFGVDIPPELSGFLEGFGAVLDGLESIDLTKPASVITGLFKTIGGLGKAIGSLFNHDSRKEKNIENLQRQIDTLQRSYDNLNSAIDKAYSSDASNLIKQQNKLLEQQKILIQNQIREEESKKNSDDERIREWRQQIEDINALIADNKEKAIDAIFGEDLKAAIENFADAYADAWASNEDRTESAKESVRRMMRQMVQESIKAAIQSSGEMERIRQKLAEFYNDGILTDWEQNYVYNMAEQLQKQLDEQFGWAESLLNDQDSRTASQKGIATASQDSVDENNARLTTIQGHTFSLVQGLSELNSTANAMLDRLSGIERNTNETSDKLNQVNDNMRKVKNAVEDIQTHGITLKR